MKKLKLKLDGIKEMLTKEQMKKISGGYSSCCVDDCPSGQYRLCYDINCFGACHYICLVGGGTCSY
jgi:hypothetical protein